MYEEGIDAPKANITGAAYLEPNSDSLQKLERSPYWYVSQLKTATNYLRAPCFDLKQISKEKKKLRYLLRENTHRQRINGVLWNGSSLNYLDCPFRTLSFACAAD